MGQPYEKATGVGQEWNNGNCMTGNRLMVGVAAVVVVVVRQSPHRGEAAPPSAMKAQQWMCGNKSNRYGDA